MQHYLESSGVITDMQARQGSRLEAIPDKIIAEVLACPGAIFN